MQVAARQDSSHAWRRRRAATASLLGVIAALALAAPGSASATCVQGVAGQSQAFTSAGQTCYTVPAGVTELNVVAVGAAGTTVFSGTAGNGTQATTRLPVTPGETLYVEVGVGGGTAAPGGGSGGGASEIVTCSVSVSACSSQFGTSADPRLLIAAGGGGNGYGGYGSDGGAAGASGSPTVTIGSNGTYVCVPGAQGTTVVVGSYETSGGGGGGTCAAGGAGGTGTSGTTTAASGSSGSSNQGGAGGGSFNGGGGGGGGYYGGGGGAGPTGSVGDGGGGGGGSSYAPLGATFAATSSTSPSVTIAALAGTASLGATSLTFAGTQPQATISSPQSVTVTDSGNAPLQITGLTFTGGDPQDFLISSDGCIGQVAAGASCQLGVSFAPQAQGARSATLQIASNDPGSPSTVSLSGTGGQLPQGPTGATGATGARGPTGPQGPPGTSGQVRLVTCKTVTRMVVKQIHGKPTKVKVSSLVCTTRVVTGTVTFTTTALAKAQLSRGRVIYATGIASRSTVRPKLLLRAIRTLRTGSYTLTLRWATGHTKHSKRELIVLR